jgi:hypothetical protein
MDLMLLYGRYFVSRQGPRLDGDKESWCRGQSSYIRWE